MIRYTSQHQLTFSGFKTPFEQQLLSDNRWVILAQVTPWDEMAAVVYHRKMSCDMGRGTVDTRLVLGVLIFKHLLKLDDREVLATLQENIYLQYFVGFSSFQTKISFDPSLLVTIRKRMGISDFKQYHRYPKLVLADKIYMTKANRDFLKKNNIEHRGQPLGRPKKDEKGNSKPLYNYIQQQEANQRNHVEGQFGTSKDAYGLNRVKAKTQITSESWIANIFFILNIVKLLKVARKAMLGSFSSLLKIFENTFSNAILLLFKTKKLKPIFKFA